MSEYNLNEAHIVSEFFFYVICSYVHESEFDNFTKTKIYEVPLYVRLDLLQAWILLLRLNWRSSGV